jgi:hypothetical protein
MFPYGSKRVYGKGCQTYRRFGMGKIHVRVSGSIKSHKYGRQWDKSEINEPSE